MQIQVFDAGNGNHSWFIQRNKRITLFSYELLCAYMNLFAVFCINATVRDIHSNINTAIYIAVELLESEKLLECDKSGMLTNYNYTCMP